MKRITNKKTLPLLVAGFALLQALFLTGCSGLLSPATNSLKKQKTCQNSNVLMADLTKAKQQRYMLPNGQECSVNEVLTDEK